MQLHHLTLVFSFPENLFSYNIILSDQKSKYNYYWNNQGQYQKSREIVHHFGAYVFTI